MGSITFYTNPMSRGRIVRWMLEEVGEPYETVVLEFGTSIKAPEFLAINPMGKVPTIDHGGTIVTEVAAICAYLADAFPGAHLAPPTDNRGSYYRWLFFTAGPVEAALTSRALGFSRRRLHRLAHRLEHDVRHAREAPCLRGVCRAACVSVLLACVRTSSTTRYSDDCDVRAGPWSADAKLSVGVLRSRRADVLVTDKRDC